MTQPAAPKKSSASAQPKDPTLHAAQLIEELMQHPERTSPEQTERHFRDDTAKDNQCIGMRMGALFALAKQFKAMPPAEISLLLDSVYYEARMAAVCIMDFRTREKKISDAERKEFFDLYINRHDRINNWDMVDRSAPHVIGAYLLDKPRDILYKLARSKNVWERRTAIVSTWPFIRKGDTTDTFKIAELLVRDAHDMIHTAVGSWIREAGKKDPGTLLDFLDRHAATMPAAMLRYATEKLSSAEKEHYRKLRKG